MSSLLLPSELKYYIAELLSPSTLASLARTHTAYQIQAEQALYHTLSILIPIDNSLRCLETLATNSEKAAYVRVLSVRHAKYDPNGKITRSFLLKGLINMHTLYDLRLKMLPSEFSQITEELHRILWSVI